MKIITFFFNSERFVRDLRLGFPHLVLYAEKEIFVALCVVRSRYVCTIEKHLHKSRFCYLCQQQC